MPRASTLCALLLTACGGARLAHPGGGLQVTVDALTLPDTFVGYPTHAPVALTNTAPSSRTVSLAVTGPFTLEQSELTLPAATDVAVAVHFGALEVGDALGVLSISSEGQTFTVALMARALPVPVCGATGPCTASAFDVAAGRCVETAVPDGADCLSGAACLVGTQCHGGHCVGAPRDCDDGNPCTTDACEADVGCVHVDAAALCPQPTDPCHAAGCDPATGCRLTELADGTACGGADCVTAHVCMRGSCQVLPVPDGAACHGGSPCQAAGVCQAQSCVQGPATPLVPAWVYTPPSGATLRFSGLGDSAGNLYWTECDGACALVSVTPDGVVRYRTALAGTEAHGGPIIVNELVVVGSDSTLEARRTLDGALVWSTDLAALTYAHPRPQRSAVPITVVDDGQGGLVMLVFVTAGLGAPVPVDLEVVGLSTATGLTRWITPFPQGNLRADLVTDDVGRTWFIDDEIVDGGPALVLYALDTNGVEVARAASPGPGPLAVLPGLLAVPTETTGLAMLSTSDAGPPPLAPARPAARPAAPTLPNVPVQMFEAGEPVLWNSGAAVLEPTSYCCPTCPCPAVTPGESLFTFDIAPVQLVWRTPLSPLPAGGPMVWVAPLSLLANGDLIFARSPVQATPWAPTLTALTSGGLTRFECELPPPALPWDRAVWPFPALVSRGRWFAQMTEECLTCNFSGSADQVVAIDLPGAALAPKGWTTSRGNPQRSGRSR